MFWTVTTDLRLITMNKISFWYTQKQHNYETEHWSEVLCLMTVIHEQYSLKVKGLTFWGTVLPMQVQINYVESQT